MAEKNVVIKVMPYTKEEETSYGVRVGKNRIVPIIYKGRCVVSFDMPIKLGRNQFQYVTDINEKIEGFTTLNELARKHKKPLEETHCYKSFSIRPRKTKNLSVNELGKIAERFKKEGFPISIAAIKHNYDAWRSGFKSGCLDENNNTFVFTPCGLNPLTFRVHSFSEHCADWMKTYTC